MNNIFFLVLFVAYLGVASANITVKDRIQYFYDGFSEVPTDQNFSVSTFVGDWNVVATYGLDFVANRSCPIVNVKKSMTSTLTITLTLMNLTTSTYDVLSHVYQPSLLNKALLIDILTPINKQNLAVSYYDDNLGEALLINTNLNFAVALTKSDNVYANMFLETVNDIFMEAQLQFNKTNIIDQFGCSTNYSVVSNFDANVLTGTFYGHAIFDSLGVFGKPVPTLKCFSFDFQQPNASSNIYNITQYMIYDDFSANYSIPFITSPDTDGFLISLAEVPTASIVVNYYDPQNNLLLLITFDGKYAFIVSTQPSLDSTTLQNLQSFMAEEGLIINNQTFYVPPTSCDVNFKSITKGFLEF